MIILQYVVPMLSLKIIKKSQVQPTDREKRITWNATDPEKLQLQI